MNSFLDIIKSIDSRLPNINPTEIYNEGWMTRLLVYYSLQEKINLEDLDFKKIETWTSEALISSPFVKADFKREGYTHADMALGDFSVDYKDRGEIKILDNAKIFGIIEAKMGSNLSQGTTHAPNYNQASRNLACIASNTFDKECEIFFGVAAPEKMLKKHEIKEQIDLNTMICQIEERFSDYTSEFKKDVKMDLIISKAKRCNVWMISYEKWIENFNHVEIKKILKEFYNKAKFWNRIDKKFTAPYNV